MKTSEYLYGVDGTEFKDLQYLDALEVKIAKAEEVLNSLLGVPYMERDTKHINDVVNARKFNRALINEVNK